MGKQSEAEAMLVVVGAAARGTPSRPRREHLTQRRLRVEVTRHRLGGLVMTQHHHLGGLLTQHHRDGAQGRRRR